MNNLCLRDPAFIAAVMETLTIITGCKFPSFPPQYFTDTLQTNLTYDLT